MGLRVAEIPEFAVPSNQAPGGAWFLPWHKIGLWTLEEYDTVVFMDADMLALGDPSELFDIFDDAVRNLNKRESLGSNRPTDVFGGSTFRCGHRSALGDPAHSYPDWTSGLMVAIPDRRLFYEMNVSASKRSSRWGSSAIPAAADGRAAGVLVSDGLYRNDQR